MARSKSDGPLSVSAPSAVETTRPSRSTIRFGLRRFGLAGEMCTDADDADGTTVGSVPESDVSATPSGSGGTGGIGSGERNCSGLVTLRRPTNLACPACCASSAARCAADPRLARRAGENNPPLADLFSPSSESIPLCSDMPGLVPSSFTSPLPSFAK